LVSKKVLAIKPFILSAQLLMSIFVPNQASFLRVRMLGIIRSEKNKKQASI